LNGLANQPVFSLSGGEQQLLLLCLTMSCRADLFLLDEPFSAIDLGRRMRAIEFVLDQLETRNVPLVFVTHTAEDARRIATRVLILSGAAELSPQVISSNDLGAQDFMYDKFHG
jgi:ABC-type nitrate/sulfonate/bicarbonate transport system ATPase subunit